MALVGALAFLPLKLGRERLLALGHGGLIALRVHPDIFVRAGLDAIQFRQHGEIRAVGAQENIARQGLQCGERAPVVDRYPGIGRGLRQADRPVASPGSHSSYPR